MLYSVVLGSAAQRHESVVSMHVSPPSGEWEAFSFCTILKTSVFITASFNQAFWVYALE